MVQIGFNTELTSNVFDEAIPLMMAHLKEIYNLDQLNVSPKDLEIYSYMEQNNAYKLFTARTVYGELVGYAGFFLRPHPHTSIMHANQDLICLREDFRGTGQGAEFIKFCEDQLRSHGATEIYQAVTPKADFSRLLLRTGYQVKETIYSKKL